MLFKFSIFMLNRNYVKVHKKYSDIFISVIYFIFDALSFINYMFGDSFLIRSAFQDI